MMGNCDNPILSDGNPKSGTIHEISDKTRLSVINKLTITMVLTFITGLSHLNTITPIAMMIETVTICETNNIIT